MKRLSPAHGSLAGIVLLCAGVFLISDHLLISRVLESVAIAAGFWFACNSFGPDRFPGACRVSFALLVLFVFWVLNPIASAFLIGALFLAAYYLSRFCGNDNEFRPHQVAAIGISIALLLAATPATVSRVILHFLDMPVAAKFTLESDSNARRSHTVSKSFPDPFLVPVRLSLNANNVALDEPMPWIGMEPRRDTEVTLHLVHYNLFHATLKQLRSGDLHQIKLSDRSDDVTLRNVKNGILITDIGNPEQAWIKLPDISPETLGPGVILKILSMKLFVWILACTAFWFWAPRPDFRPE